jgi:sRNA-binding regulator protein Hfq
MNSLTRKKVHVEMYISNGTMLKGALVIDRTTRLSDMLNNLKKEFIVLLDPDNRAHMINKQHIVKIIELSEE